MEPALSVLVKTWTTDMTEPTLIAVCTESPKNSVQQCDLTIHITDKS